uniref:Uncharacterized protein n=1 Tax=Phocoena sinus TaxID=42100 RepID=A0A8C9CB03_PHOSS
TLTSRRSCVSPGTRKVRSSTQRERNTRLQSSARLIKKMWTHKFCEESKLFLSSRVTSALCLLSQTEFILTKQCSKLLTKNLIKITQSISCVFSLSLFFLICLKVWYDSANLMGC